MFPRNNRLVDFSPESYIHSSYVVSRTSESALSTLEFISCRSIVLRDMSAGWAGSGSVPRVYQDQRDTSDLSFVVHKHPQKSEIPSMQATTLSLPNRDSVSNALKILKGYRSKSVFGFRNKLLRDAMVNVLREPCHSTRELLEMAFGRLSAFALKAGLKNVKSVSGLVSLLSRMDFSVRINSKILNSKISTKNAFGFIWYLFRYFNHNTKVEDAFNKNQVRLSSDPVEPSLLIISHSNRDSLPTVQCGKRDLLKAFPRENPLVVNDSTIKPKLWFNRPISLVGFSNLRNCSNSQLSRQTVFLSDGVVNILMEFKLISGMSLKDGICYLITSFVKSLHCFAEHLVLLWRGIKLNHQSMKHLLNIIVNRSIGMFVVHGESNRWGTLLHGLMTGISPTPTPHEAL